MISYLFSSLHILVASVRLRSTQRLSLSTQPPYTHCISLDWDQPRSYGHRHSHHGISQTEINPEDMAIDTATIYSWHQSDWDQPRGYGHRHSHHLLLASVRLRSTQRLWLSTQPPYTLMASVRLNIDHEPCPDQQGHTNQTFHSLCITMLSCLC